MPTRLAGIQHGAGAYKWVDVLELVVANNVWVPGGLGSGKAITFAIPSQATWFDLTTNLAFEISEAASTAGWGQWQTISGDDILGLQVYGYGQPDVDGSKGNLRYSSLLPFSSVFGVGNGKVRYACYPIDGPQDRVNGAFQGAVWLELVCSSNIEYRASPDRGIGFVDFQFTVENHHNAGTYQTHTAISAKIRALVNA